jgi:cytochrome c oxidase cbb3-type subunit 3
MSGFWSLWIIVITLGNIFACYWLVRWTTKKRPNEAAQGDVTGHSWDGLQEYNNPLPRWWLWLFYITIVFALVYLLLFPGLGTFKGVLGWSSHGTQYEEEMAKADATYGPIFEKYAAMPLADVAQDEEALGMGKRMFLNYCAQCHGSDAGGATGFPNLTDADWLYGNQPEQITQTILNGRNGVMPPHKDRVDEAGLEALTQYVMSLSGRDADADKVAEGQKLFVSNGCLACHGVDGKGNQMLGGPNLTDNIWLYGSSAETIKHTIAEGRMGQMPAHKDFLGEDKVHLLAAYVLSLSEGKDGE